MSYETESFIDIARLTTKTGKVPSEIPAHYWHFCFALRRNAKGNKVPSLGWQGASLRSSVIKLPFGE